MIFEWADVNPGDEATIYNDGELARISADGVEPGTVGVSMATGSNGVMLTGRAEDLIAWAEDVARRLRAGEGVASFGEARTFQFVDKFHPVTDANGDVYDAQQLDVGHELRDNCGDPADEHGRSPAGEGDTWRVMRPGYYGKNDEGQLCFLIETRKVIR